MFCNSDLIYQVLIPAPNANSWTWRRANQKNWHSPCRALFLMWYCFQQGVYDVLIEQKPIFLRWTSWTSGEHHREMARNAVCVFHHKRCPVAVQFTCGTLPINTVQQVNLYWNGESATHNLWYVHFQQVNMSSRKDPQSCMWSNHMKCFVTVRARSGKLTIHRNQYESKCEPATTLHPLASLFDTEICWGSPCWVWSLFTHDLWMGETRLNGLL